METFELLPVLAAGDLAQTSAPELVAAIYRSRASGTLSLEGESKEEIRLFFKLGNSCGAARLAGFRSLAEILLAQKTLSADQAERAAAEASVSGKRLGEVLVGLRMLTPEQLQVGLATQHRENLRLMLFRNVGRYEWRGWEPPPAWANEVTVDPTRAILEALALPQLAGRRQTVLRWLGDAQVRASFDFAELAPKAELLVADRRAAEQFVTPLLPEAFLNRSGLQRSRAEALLVTLLLVGGVEPVPSEAAQPLDASLFEPALPGARAAFELDAEEPAAPPPPPAEVAIEVAEAAEQQLANERAAALELQALESEEISEPVPAAAPPDDLGAELAAELAADFGADAALHAGPLREPPPLDADELFADPDGPEADPLLMAASAAASEEIVVHDLEPELALAPAEAMFPADVEPPAPVYPAADLEVEHDAPIDLVQPPSLHETRVDLFGGRQTRSGADFLLDASDQDPMPDLELVPAHEPVEPTTDSDSVRKRLLSVGLRNLGLGRAPIPSDDEAQGNQFAAELRDELAPLPLTDEERCFLEDVRARLKVAPKQDAYARLGVSQGVPQEHVRTSYLKLVKKFHPDRAQSSPGLRQAAGDLDALFGFLRDAYEAVGSAAGRAQYDASGKRGAGKPLSRADDARLSLKKGEVFLKKRDFENALRELRRSVDLDATPQGMTALAWALASDKSQVSAAGREEALQLVGRALKLDPRDGRSHYVAGVLRRSTEPDAAFDHFRKAVELDPKNADAALELRLIERRRDQKRPITGPLSRLFKRDGK